MADGHPVELNTNELVVTYDLMCEAATELKGLYAMDIGAGGADDPAIKRMREIRREVEAVDPDDLAAQRAMTAKLRSEYDELDDASSQSKSGAALQQPRSRPV